MIFLDRDMQLAVRRALTIVAFGVMSLVAAPASHAQSYTVLYSFAGGPNDGAGPNGDLVEDANGNFFGTTWRGGLADLGTVFELDSSGHETILHNFTGAADGSHPDGGLLLDATGNLYGTTVSGGSNGLGTVFALGTDNVVTSLHSFKGGTDGAQPISRLVSVNGELYGVTQYGGTASSSCINGSCGTIFKVTKGGKETVLYRFTPTTNGSLPQGLVRDDVGNLYGITGERMLGGGDIFKLDTGGVFSVLFSITNANPIGRLIRDANGDMHGVTEFGGKSPSSGYIFRLGADGEFSLIHNFAHGEDGYRPRTGLLDAGGTLYGTTHYGGAEDCDCGVLFQVTKTGQYEVVHAFGGATSGDGSDSEAGSETFGSDGSIYGATRHGGTGVCKGGTFAGCGVIFKYTPAEADRR